MSRAPSGQLRLGHYLPYRLSVAAHSVASLIAVAYRPMRLQGPQWRILALLHEHGSLSQQQLVPLSTMDKQTISRAVRGLLQRRLLLRAVSRTDARAFELRLSPAGERCYRRAVPVALEHERLLLVGLSSREVAVLQTALRRLEESARRLAGSAMPRILTAQRRQPVSGVLGR